MAFMIFGYGSLENNMKKTVIYLTSVGYKIFATIITIIAGIFTIFLICNYPEIPWYASAYMCFVLLFCCFCCFLCFNHKIIFLPSKSIVKCCALKSTTILISELQNVEVSTVNSINPKKFSNIVFTLKTGKRLFFSGYDSLSKRKSTLKTIQKINELKKILETYERYLNSIMKQY